MSCDNHGGVSPASPGTADLLTSAQVAELFGVSTKSVHRWARDGELEHIRTPGGSLRFYRADVDRFLAPDTNGEGGDHPDEAAS